MVLLKIACGWGIFFCCHNQLKRLQQLDGSFVWDLVIDQLFVSPGGLLFVSFLCVFAPAIKNAQKEQPELGQLSVSFGYCGSSSAPAASSMSDHIRWREGATLCHIRLSNMPTSSSSSFSFISASFCFRICFINLPSCIGL